MATLSPDYSWRRLLYFGLPTLLRLPRPHRPQLLRYLNKVVRAEYPNPLYTKLGLEAIEAWKGPESIFMGVYREPGWVMTAHCLIGWWFQSTKVAEQAG